MDRKFNSIEMESNAKINVDEARWRAKAGYRGVEVKDGNGKPVAVWNYISHSYCGSVGSFYTGGVSLVREDGTIIPDEETVYMDGVPHVLRKPGRRYADGTEVYVPTLIKVAQ